MVGLVWFYLIDGLFVYQERVVQIGGYDVVLLGDVEFFDWQCVIDIGIVDQDIDCFEVFVYCVEIGCYLVFVVDIDDVVYGLVVVFEQFLVGLFDEIGLYIDQCDLDIGFVQCIV